jgi:hypothetical protein
VVNPACDGPLLTLSRNPLLLLAILDLAADALVHLIRRARDARARQPAQVV